MKTWLNMTKAPSHSVGQWPVQVTSKMSHLSWYKESFFFMPPAHLTWYFFTDISWNKILSVHFKQVNFNSAVPSCNYEKKMYYWVNRQCTLYDLQMEQSWNCHWKIQTKVVNFWREGFWFFVWFGLGFYFFVKSSLKYVFSERKRMIRNIWVLTCSTCSVWAEFTWCQFSFLPPSGYKYRQGQFGNWDLLWQTFCSWSCQKERGSIKGSSWTSLPWNRVLATRNGKTTKNLCMQTETLAGWGSAF